jgi:hypothetical protein
VKKVKLKKPNVSCFSLGVESRPKMIVMMMVVMIGHECKRELSEEDQWDGRGGMESREVTGMG